MLCVPTPKALMVVATKQHVGKTSLCMTLLHACRKKFGPRVGFMKPVGQRWVEVAGEKIDKDVNLARTHFGLHNQPREMSPVVIEQVSHHVGQ